VHAFVSVRLEADMALEDYNNTITFALAQQLVETLNAIDEEDDMWELVQNLADLDPVIVQKLCFAIHSNFIDREITKQGEHYAN
tara:strand:+ start:524 stop:775 length:252 start_codon:yes stop_codon:yes gene_type:complete